MNLSQRFPAACDGCGTAQSVCRIIHTLRYRATDRRFCTNCVLKQHQGIFCPICFELFDDSLLPHLRLMCVRCPSIAHRSCVLPSTADPAAPAPAFLCPACADPNFHYFKLPDRSPVEMDVRSAKVLVTAARIAANAMRRAAAAARLEAERRAVEAVVARKKAIEALDHLANLMEEQQREASRENQKTKKGSNSATKNAGPRMKK